MHERLLLLGWLAGWSWLVSLVLAGAIDLVRRVGRALPSMAPRRTMALNRMATLAAENTNTESTESRANTEGAKSLAPKRRANTEGTQPLARERPYWVHANTTYRHEAPQFPRSAARRVQNSHIPSAISRLPRAQLAKLVEVWEINTAGLTSEKLKSILYQIPAAAKPGHCTIEVGYVTKCVIATDDEIKKSDEGDESDESDGDWGMVPEHVLQHVLQQAPCATSDSSTKPKFQVCLERGGD